MLPHSDHVGFVFQQTSPNFVRDSPSFFSSFALFYHAILAYPWLPVVFCEQFLCSGGASPSVCSSTSRLYPSSFIWLCHPTQLLQPFLLQHASPSRVRFLLFESSQHSRGAGANGRFSSRPKGEVESSEKYGLPRFGL